MRRMHASVLLLVLMMLGTFTSMTKAAVIVAAGDQSKVSGVYIPADEPALSAIRYAAADLVTAIQGMSGAVVSIVEVAAASEIPAGPAVVLGRLANELGAAPSQSTFWLDVTRTVIRDGRILIAGESDIAVNAGVMDLLHEQGVRYFLPSVVPGDIGTVIPTRATVEWSDRDHERHPFIRGRRIWGHNMDDPDIRQRGSQLRWVRRNVGESAVMLTATHAWSGLVNSKKHAGEPELFAIRRYDEQGNPVRGSQLCVSNPRVAELMSQVLIERFEADPMLRSHSIAPNDGGGGCVCHNCRALDAPGYLEPTSGAPVLSDRYIWFFNRVAKAVAEKFPDRKLTYLVYSDYTRQPRRETQMHPMIVPVVAPIRFPRMHSMFNPLSEANIRQRHIVEAYNGIAEGIGYYGYNYNLAETIVPFSKISIWSEDLPFLARQKLQHVTIETLGNWNSNGPHIYLSARYLYSGEDPKAIMADYFEKLGGAAGDDLRAYWQAVDDAFRESDIHSGSFYGIEQILTEPVLNTLQGHMDRAKAKASNEWEHAVVAFFQSGLDLGRLTITLINQLNGFEFLEARATRDKHAAMSTDLETKRIVSKYPNTYRNWFLDHIVDHAAAIFDAGGRTAVRFPDTWNMRQDYYDVGVEEQWFDPTHGSGKWLTVRTWGHPSLYSQGHGAYIGYQWFKVTVDVPEQDAGKLWLWLGSTDGPTRVWVNGQPVTFEVEQRQRGEDGKQTMVKQATLEHTRGWRAFAASVGALIKPGQPNTFVIRVQNQLNDLNLGGILRPVMLYVPGDAESGTVTDTYKRIDM